MTDVDKTADELIDFINKNSLLLVKCPDEYPPAAHIIVWSANAQEQIAEFLRRSSHENQC